MRYPSSATVVEGHPGAGEAKPRTGLEPSKGACLIGAVLAGENLSGRDLSGADLSGADLSGAGLRGAKLRDAILFQANLSGADLMSADLSGADLTECRAERAGFGNANLTGASLFAARMHGATFSAARLVDADLRTADLRGSRMREADLTRANLARADLTGVDLEGCTVPEACFDDTSLRQTCLRGIVGFEKASWLRADVNDVDFGGVYLLRRFLMDQNYIDEFRSRQRWLYRLWWATSDCGRSLARWALFVGLVAVAFGGAYTVVPIDYGAHPTAFSPFYFSIVTLTTLGYGDVLPASATAQVLATMEVVIGYVMLGGMLSIFATKMARRAE